MFSKAKAFSHIYVEEAAREHPRTHAILERFPASKVVLIDDYQNVFGRGRQDFWKQKASPKLILAVKKDNFLYAGNELLQGNQSPNFCYNALVLNCPYDCHYCYLQGMYAGANMVAFVNLEDYFEAAEVACRERPVKDAPLHLAISYDTDLLALESKLGFAREWVEWSRGRNDILIEIRTKSTASRLLDAVPPARSIRLAWTLSPDPVAKRYESGAPALAHRLKAIRKAADAGWRISLCLDPVLKLPDSASVYDAFTRQLGEEIPWEAVERVEVGVFRVGSTFFKRMLKRPDTDLLQYPYEHDRNAVSYNREERQWLVDEVCRPLQNNISNEKIFIWT